MLNWLREAFAAAKRAFRGEDQSLVVVFGNIIRVFARAVIEGQRATRAFLLRQSNAIDRFTAADRRFARAAGDAIRDLYDRYVPRSIAVATGRLWTRAQQDAVRRERILRDLVETRRQELIRSIARLRAYVNDHVDELHGRINTVSSRLSRLTRNLAHVLGGPERLARWLVAALIPEMWRYVQANELRIGLWLVTRSVLWTMGFALRIERLLARLI